MEEGAWKAGASARVSENNRRDPGGGSTPASIWRLERTWRVSRGQEGRSQLGENDAGGGRAVAGASWGLPASVPPPPSMGHTPRVIFLNRSRYFQGSCCPLSAGLARGPSPMPGAPSGVLRLLCPIQPPSIPSSHSTAFFPGFILASAHVPGLRLPRRCPSPSSLPPKTKTDTSCLLLL